MRARLLHLLRPTRRFQSTTPPQPPPASRLHRVLDKTPRFMRPYTDGLRSAPVSHIASFLILHELTALIPLVALASAFHWTAWTPGFVSAESVEMYREMFGRYFGRKGWFGVGEEGQGGEGDVAVVGGGERMVEVGEGGYATGGTRIVLEVATAYAITKAMLPLRIVGSVWATPWFARVVLGRFKRFGRR